MILWGSIFLILNFDVQQICYQPGEIWVKVDSIHLLVAKKIDLKKHIFARLVSVSISLYSGILGGFLICTRSTVHLSSDKTREIIYIDDDVINYI